MHEHKNGPGQRALRTGRVSLPDHAYFITKCTLKPVGNLLTQPEVAKILIDSFLWARNNNWWKILSFTIMPSHYHINAGLGNVKTLSAIIGSIDRFTSTQINRIVGREGQFWEAGFYDHGIRDRRDFDDVLDYVHMNAINAGLADMPEDWPFSTAHPKYSGEIDWEWLGASLPDICDAKHRFDRSSIPPQYR